VIANAGVAASVAPKFWPKTGGVNDTSVAARTAPASARPARSGRRAWMSPAQTSAAAPVKANETLPIPAMRIPTVGEYPNGVDSSRRAPVNTSTTCRATTPPTATSSPSAGRRRAGARASSP